MIITNRGEVKIVDFGLAKLAMGTRMTKTGRTVGTAAYMSPEQVRGETVDQRADIWSFGVVLYEMLTGQLPFKSDYEQAVFYSILNENPQAIKDLRGDVPLELQTIVKNCVEKEPNQRYQTAVDLVSQLKRLKREMSSREVVVEKPKTARPLLSPVSLHRLLIPAAAVILAFLILLLIPSGRKTMQDWLGITPIPKEKHLVVLAFTYEGDDPSNQAMVDGLVETLNSKLSRLEQFHRSFWVVPASELHKSAEVYKRRISSATDARQAFGVNLVLTGSVALSGDDFHLRLLLIDTETLEELRSAVIQDRRRNISILQEETVTKMAEMLDVKLDSQSHRLLTAGGTTVSGAYEFYLKGQGYLKRYEKMVDLVTAISSIKQAIEQDSLYASAYAALGECYWRRYEATKDTQWVEAALSNCERAAELDDLLEPVHVTLGLIYKGMNRNKQAIEEFQRALALDPFSTAAYRGLAEAYQAQGRLEETESTYQKAIQLKRDYWAGYKDLGLFYLQYEQLDDAVTQFRQVLILTPDDYLAHSNLGGIYYHLDSLEDARQMFERSLAIEQSWEAFSNLGTVYYLEGRYGEAVSMFKGALEFNDQDHEVWGNLASAYYWTPGERDKALEVYQRAIEMAVEQAKVNPYDPEVLSLLGGYYSMIGQRAKAVPLTEQALSIAPKHGEVMYRAGHAYEQLGEHEKAVYWIGKALESGYSRREIEHEPGLRQLRADARFQQLLQKNSDQSGENTDRASKSNKM